MIHADFECCLKPSDEEHIGTNAFNTHEVSGFCVYTVAQSPGRRRDSVAYSGENIFEHF